MKFFGKLIIVICLLQLTWTIQSCKKSKNGPPIDENVDLDGSKINDSSLILPAAYLLSSAIPNPTPADLLKPVIIAVHGFSASNFEWTEFRDWAKTKNDFLTSLVLLGGHGRNYNSFKAANWEEWQAPIIEEYNKLQKLGYKKISIVSSSTGCPLVLEMVDAGKISNDVLAHLFFIDPIIVPANKTLSLVRVVGPILVYSETAMDPGENGYWYKYRPQAALDQLEKLIVQERKKLEKGITLPTGVSLKVYKAKTDGAADPNSAVLLKKGIKLNDGSEIDVEMIDSDLHVFTRLHGRAEITTDQKNLQIKTFNEIYSALLK